MSPCGELRSPYGELMSAEAELMSPSASFIGIYSYLKRRADMAPSVLREKSEAFSARIVACCRVLRERKVEYSLIDQLLRAGTSVGANIAEARYANGTKDFVFKLRISLKEINETEHWISVLHKNQFISQKEYSSLRSDAIAIRRMLSASIRKLENKN